MHDTLQLLNSGSFPQIYRDGNNTIQVNLGYRCNQSCLHCHVNAGPNRTEMMTRDTVNDVIELVRHMNPTTVDLTGGAPELHSEFRYLVKALRDLNIAVIDRCNLTILSEPGQEGLAKFLAENQVNIVASLPCYTEDNVNQQRGDGVFAASLEGLRKLNKIGYGTKNSLMTLNLVYNPIGTALPPPQKTLENDYRAHLWDNYRIKFDSLLTLTNMPIKRFGSTLVSKGEFDGYMSLLRDNFDKQNLKALMCKSLISVDWEGYVYDCDFNQMLGLNFSDNETKIHIRDISSNHLRGKKIAVRDHCFGCAAGQGSSCSGALQ